jgi:hypothetical protein
MYDFPCSSFRDVGSVLAQGMSAKKRHEVGTQSEIHAVGDLLVGKMTMTLILQSLFFCLT